MYTSFSPVRRDNGNPIYHPGQDSGPLSGNKMNTSDIYGTSPKLLHRAFDYPGVARGLSINDIDRTKPRKLH